jgi:hypothetical protein
MKNFWLERFRIGKRVRYKGADANLSGKVGYIQRVHGDWIDVQFEFPGKMVTVKTVSVEKDNLEII